MTSRISRTTITGTMRTLYGVAFAALLILTATAGVSVAATYVVRDDGSGDFATIQLAITAASHGDIIELADGEFRGPGNRDLDTLGKAITIRSQSGDPATCMINCEGYYSGPHFGFVIQSGEGPGTVIEGLNIIQGYPEVWGGTILAAGITCLGTSPSIRHCEIAHSGGVIDGSSTVAATGVYAVGVLLIDASPHIEDTVIHANHASVDAAPAGAAIHAVAGGLASEGGHPVLERCDIRDNTASINALPWDVSATTTFTAAAGVVLLGDGDEVVEIHQTWLTANEATLSFSAVPPAAVTQINLAGGLASSGVDLVNMVEPRVGENRVFVSLVEDCEAMMLLAGGLASDHAYIEQAGANVSANIADVVDMPEGGVVAAGYAGYWAPLRFHEPCEFSDNVTTWVGVTPIRPGELAPNLVGGALAGRACFSWIEGTDFSLNRIVRRHANGRHPLLAGAGAAFYGQAVELHSCNLLDNHLAVSIEHAPVEGTALMQMSGGLALDGIIFAAYDTDFYGNRCEGALVPLSGSLGRMEAAGAVLISIGEVYLSGCDLVNNLSGVDGESSDSVIAAGALCSRGTETTDTVECFFENNSAQAQGEAPRATIGGAIAANDHYQVRIDDCVFKANLASAGPLGAVADLSVGGALAVFEAGPRVVNGRFAANEVTSIADPLPVSSAVGGGIACLGFESSFDWCVIESNRVVSLALPVTMGAAVAGGLALRDHTTAIDHCTLADNEAPPTLALSVVAGGLAVHGASGVDVSNTIIAFSSVGAGAIAGLAAGVHFTCSDIYGNAGGDWYGSLSVQLGVDGNISDDPLFCRMLNPAEPLTIAIGSCCDAPHNPVCGLVGALPSACVMTGVVDESPSSSALRLHPAQPNPFNPRTEFEFEVPAEQRVTLTVHSARGERLATLVDDVRSAGRHRVVWMGVDDEGRHLPSGAYLVRLHGDGVERMEKVALVR